MDSCDPLSLWSQPCCTYNWAHCSTDILTTGENTFTNLTAPVLSSFIHTWWGIVCTSKYRNSNSCMSCHPAIGILTEETPCPANDLFTSYKFNLHYSSLSICISLYNHQVMTISIMCRMWRWYVYIVLCAACGDDMCTLFYVQDEREKERLKAAAAAIKQNRLQVNSQVRWSWGSVFVSLCLSSVCLALSLFSVSL